MALSLIDTKQPVAKKKVAANPHYFYRDDIIVAVWQAVLKQQCPSLQFAVSASRCVSTLFHGTSQTHPVGLLCDANGHYTAPIGHDAWLLCQGLTDSSQQLDCLEPMTGSLAAAMALIRSWNQSVKTVASRTAIATAHCLFPLQHGSLHWVLGQLTVTIRGGDVVTAHLIGQESLHATLTWDRLFLHLLTAQLQPFASSKHSLKLTTHTQCLTVQHPYDGASCGAIIAEWGAALLQGHPLCRPKSTRYYPIGMTAHRQQHLTLLNDDAFAEEQAQNRFYRDPAKQLEGLAIDQAVERLQAFLRQQPNPVTHELVRLTDHLSRVDDHQATECYGALRRWFLRHREALDHYSLSTPSGTTLFRVFFTDDTPVRWRPNAFDQLHAVLATWQTLRGQQNLLQMREEETKEEATEEKAEESVEENAEKREAIDAIVCDGISGVMDTPQPEPKAASPASTNASMPPETTPPIAFAPTSSSPSSPPPVPAPLRYLDDKNDTAFAAWLQEHPKAALEAMPAGRPLIIEALERSCWRIASMLLTAGASLSQTDPKSDINGYGYWAQHSADKAARLWLQQSFPRFDRLTTKGALPPLWQALARFATTETVSALLPRHRPASNALLQATDAFGKTLLALSLHHDNLDLADYLIIRSPAAVKTQRTSQGITPLLLAVAHGAWKQATALWPKTAEALSHHCDDQGQHLLFYWVEGVARTSLKVATAWLQRHANDHQLAKWLTQGNSEGTPVLHVMAKPSRLPLITWWDDWIAQHGHLINRHDWLNQTNRYDYHVLHRAGHDAALVTWLRQRQATLTTLNRNGDLPYHLAENATAALRLLPAIDWPSNHPLYEPYHATIAQLRGNTAKGATVTSLEQTLHETSTLWRAPHPNLPAPLLILRDTVPDALMQLCWRWCDHVLRLLNHLCGHRSVPVMAGWGQAQRAMQFAAMAARIAQQDRFSGTVRVLADHWLDRVTIRVCQQLCHTQSVYSLDWPTLRQHRRTITHPSRPTFLKEDLVAISDNHCALLKTLWCRAINNMPTPVPCDYTLVALGSVARGEAAPYSDLEAMVLVEQATETVRDYFQTVACLVKCSSDA